MQRAWNKVEEGMVGFVNVKTDYRPRATTVRFFDPRDLNGRFHVTRWAPRGTPSCSMCAKRWLV